MWGSNVSKASSADLQKRALTVQIAFRSILTDMVAPPSKFRAYRSSDSEEFSPRINTCEEGIVETRWEAINRKERLREGREKK